MSRAAAWIDASATDAVSLGLSVAQRLLFDQCAPPSRASLGTRQHGPPLLLEGQAAPAAVAPWADDGFEGEQARVAEKLTKVVGAGMLLLAVEIAFHGMFRNIKSASRRRRTLLGCVLSGPGPRR